MKRLFKISAAAFFLSLLVMFVTGSAYPAEKDTPDTCARCLMKINKAERKFSAGNIKRTIPVSFCDIGCALLYRRGLCASDQADFDFNAKVYNYYTEEEIGLTAAFYVVDSGTRTPMGYDIVAFKNKQDAEKFIAERGKGKILKFSDVELIDWEKRSK